jgi:hypothetical protein
LAKKTRIPAAPQLQALQESYALTGEPLQAWCREHGLFPHNLTSWKLEMSNAKQGRFEISATK